MLDNVIQEIDVATGRLLFEWHSVGNVGLRESYDRRPDDGTQFDYFHLNAVEEAPDGDLLVSARNTCALYEIDRATGAINWRLGGRRSDFRLGEGVRFCRQHDARWAGDGVITLFDNRIAAPTERGQSRAIKLSVDEARKRVSLLRGYKHPAELGAPNKGGARMQPNGNLLVGWGAVPAVTEFTRRGDIVFDARFAGAHDGSYRASRAEWVGMPVTRPDVAAERRGSRVAVWASWNGATEVARWEVLGGDARDALAPVALVAAERLRDGAQRSALALRGGPRARRLRRRPRDLEDRHALASAAMWVQREITLRPRPRGFHLVTDEVVSALPELRELRVGLAHLFILHTSASLTLNENASPDVRRDFETWFNEVVPGGRAVLGAHDRGPGRHARPHQGVAARPVALAPGQPRPARPRHVAGRLPVRAPRPRRRALARRDARSESPSAPAPDGVALLGEGRGALARVL